MVLATTLFVASVPASGLSAQTSHREPIPPIPNDPPIQPACPAMEPGTTCTRTGEGTASTYSMAASLAQLACDPKIAKCQLLQYREYIRNRDKCESEPGCKITYQLRQHSCHADPLPGGDCNNSTQDGGATQYTCVADGEYDIWDYHCERPTTGGTDGPGTGTGGKETGGH